MLKTVISSTSFMSMVGTSNENIKNIVISSFLAMYYVFPLSYTCMQIQSTVYFFRSFPHLEWWENVSPVLFIEDEMHILIIHSEVRIFCYSINYQKTRAHLISPTCEHVFMYYIQVSFYVSGGLGS